MAREDDDIALSLPQPPPPAPAKREAAISEAMRRFDAQGDIPRAAPAKPVPQRGGSWWGKPQLGVLVAASLVAVIGLPVAWLTINQKTVPATELASRDTSDLPTLDDTGDIEANRPAAMPPSDAVETQSEAAATEHAKAVVSPQQAVARDETEVPEAGEAKRADNANDDRNQAVLAQAVRVPRPAAISAPPAPAAAPPPPPAIMHEAPAPAKPREELAAADSTGSIIVTAARRRGVAKPDRGDWNACTINDPKRSLAACKYLINPGAKDAKGRSAAHIADGLSLGWQGNISRAIAAFDQAITIAPKSSLAYLNRGLAYQQQGDSDRALQDFDQAVRLAPSAARGYYNRSLLLRERGDAKRAKADQERAINLDMDYQAVID